MTTYDFIRRFDTIGREEVASVGGKNASLGELTQALSPAGIRVPDGFAVTVDGFHAFVTHNSLGERLAALIGGLSDMSRRNALAAEIRGEFLAGAMPPGLREAVVDAYRALCGDDGAVAVRSSATAEDLPDASFAGQQESFLNVRGLEPLLEALQRCYASLFTDRAIAYREAMGFDHNKVFLSVGVQRMVRSDLGSAGVMFTLDTESGFPNMVLINAAWGLGETIVQGMVVPDEYRVFKPLLGQRTLRPIVDKVLGTKAHKMVYAYEGTDPTVTVPTTADERDAWVLDDDTILTLARWAVTIEEHYGCAMDIEWARDGETGELHIVQARPETVHSQRTASVLRRYKLTERSPELVTGLSVGDAIGAGRVCVVRDVRDIERVTEGDVLVAEMTHPDWVPIMRNAAAIVTDRGGRTCHAAIVGRELGVPVVVGAGDATERLSDGRDVTVSCAEGDVGHVYEGKLPFETIEVDLTSVPETRTHLMMNIATPDAAVRWWKLPADGIGLARMEFVIGSIIRVHPMALVEFDSIEDPALRSEILSITRGFADKSEYFVDHLARGIAKIAAAQFPRPVVIRTSDFKSNEYAALVGGAQFEVPEENPMIGFRGASRYYDDRYRAAFELECRAVHRARTEMGLTNVIVMIPFCRTVGEADKVLEVMSGQGLVRGEEGLAVWVMAEIPSNVLMAHEFAQRFDGFSIGSNDLTQLVLGVDRDSELLAGLFDERDPAVRAMIAQMIEAGHAAGRTVSFCGQAPSDHPGYAEFLVECGIDSISLNPDSLVATRHRVAAAEAKLAD